MSKENAQQDPVKNDDEESLDKKDLVPEDEQRSADYSAYRFYDEYESQIEKDGKSKEPDVAEALRTLISARKPRKSGDSEPTVTETGVSPAQGNETPVAETLVTETRVTEKPVTETLVAETPVAETPVTETLVTETPVSRQPAATEYVVAYADAGDAVAKGGDKPAPVEKDNLSKLQDVLVDRVDRIDQIQIRPALINAAIEHLKAIYESLPPDAKKQMEAIFADPAKAKQLAEAFIKEQLKKSADRLSGGDISDDDLAKMKKAVDRGEIPPALLKAWLEQERNSKECGPATKGAYAGLVADMKSQADEASRLAEFNGKVPPEKSPTLPDASKLSSKKPPGDADISSLEKMEKWIASVRGEKNKDLDRLQSFLEPKVDRIGGDKLFQSTVSQRSEQLKELFAAGKLPDAQMQELKKAQKEGKFDAALQKMAGEQIKQTVVQYLDRQVASGALKAAERDSQKADLEKGIINPATAAALVKQEHINNVHGAFTRGALSAYAQDLQTRVPATVQDIEANRKTMPADSPAAPIATVKDKVQLNLADVTKVPSEEDFKKFKESSEKVEKWLESAARARNKDIDRVQQTLVGLLPTIDRDVVLQQLKIPVKAEMEQQVRDGVLPADEKKALTGLRGKEYEDKFNELVEARVKKALSDEIDRQIKEGTTDEAVGKQLKELVEKGAIPNEALVGMLATETVKNSYGPTTKALWAASVATYEQKTGQMVTALGANGLPIPPDCPIKIALGQFGRPQLREGFDSEVAGGELRWKSGIDLSKPPTEDDVKKLTQAAKWNQEASSSVISVEKKFQQRVLEETVTQLKQPGWLPKDGQDRQQWYAAVAPMVDLAREVKSCAQALALAKRFTGNSSINFSKSALTSDFPGKVELDKDGRIIKIHLDLPTDTTPSYENKQKLDRLQKWLEANREPAQQCMKQLADAATNQNAILMWADLPGNGKVPGSNTDYNLQRHRFEVEDTTNDKGERVIRVRNRVDYYQSHWYNYQDWGATKVGDQHYKTKDAEGKEADVREYKPTDMIVVMKDGKAQLIMAQDLEKFRANEELMQNIDKGINVAMDVGMLVMCAVQVGAAFQAAKLAAQAGKLAAAEVAAVLKMEAQAALRSALKHAAKDFALGVSGLLMNNAEVRSSSLGQFAHHVRNLVFVADAAYSLYSIGKGFAVARGLINGEKLTAEAIQAQKILNARLNPKLLEMPKEWSTFEKSMYVGGKAVHAGMFACELGLIWRMTGPTLKEIGHCIWEGPRPASLGTATTLYRRTLERDGEASRFMKGMADSLSAKKPELRERLREIAGQIDGLDKLTDEEKQKRIKELIDKHDAQKLVNEDLEPKYSKEERMMMALVILELSKKDGKIPDIVLSETYDDPEFGGWTTEWKSADLQKEIGEGIKTGDASTRLACAQALLAQEKLGLAEYAVACRGILSEESASRDLKMQALMGLTLCIDGMNQKGGTAEDRFKAFAQSLGCTPADLEKNIADVASNDKDPEVRAMAATLLHALHEPDANKSQMEMATAVSTYRAMKASTDIADLEKQIAAADPKDKPKLEATLALRKLERDSAREMLAYLNNPNLKADLEKEQKQRESTVEQARLKVLSTAGDIKQLEEKLASGQFKGDDKPQAEEILKQKKEKLKEQQAELKLAEQAATAKSGLDVEKLPAVPTSLNEAVVSRLIADLRAPEPPTSDAVKHYEWSVKKLEAARLLERLGGEKEERWKPAEVSKAVASLVDKNNGQVSLEALNYLLPDRIKSLDAETRDRLLANIKDILWSKHEGTTDTDRATAMLKLKFLPLVPKLADALSLDNAAREPFRAVAASLIDSSKTNFAGQYPELRKAAIETLAAMGAGGETMLELIRQRLKFDEKSATAGEPDASVRLAAFKALESLRDKKLPELAKLHALTERDPELQTRMQALEWTMVRPGIDDKRIFQMEVEYYKAIIDGAGTRIGMPAAEKYLMDNFPVLASITDEKDPEGKAYRKRYTAAYADYRARMKAIGGDDEWVMENPFTGGKYWRVPQSVKIERRKAAFDETLGVLYQDRNKQWDDLCRAANQPGKEGDKARMAMLYMATQCGDYPGGGTDMAKEACQKICDLVKKKPPVCDAALLSAGMLEAFMNGSTNDQRRHDVRMNLLGALESMVDDGLVSKHAAGHIAAAALRAETTAARLDELSVGSWMKTAELKGLLKLIDKCQYPLAMVELTGLAERNDRFNKPCIDKSVSTLAAEILGRLRDARPIPQGDVDQRAAGLRATTDARDKFIKTMDAATAAFKEGGDKAADARKAAFSKDMDEGDSRKVRLAIDAAMTNAPIRDLKDPRIPLLQKLMKDPDKTVAMMAAWWLVNSINPANSNDSTLRSTLVQSQPFREAYQKLKDLAGDKEEGVKADATRLKEMVDKWGMSFGAPVQAADKDSVFEKSKAVLDGTKKDATTAHKKEAIEHVVEQAMKARAMNNFDLARRCEDLLNQVASGKDREVGRAAFEAFQKVVAANPPTSDAIDVTGARVIKWANGGQTRIETHPDGILYSYPDGKWLKLNINNKGEVDGYLTSDSKDKKVVGTDFKPGSVGIGADGSVFFDDENGVRRVKEAQGTTSTFFRGTPDLKKESAALEVLLKNKEASGADKARAILDSTSGSSFDGGPIKTADDPRLALLKGKDGLESDNKEVRMAAAKALLNQANVGIESELKKKAATVFLKEGGTDIFALGSAQEVLRTLQQAQALLGVIKDSNDPRVKMFSDAIRHESVDVRLAAARVILDPASTGFSTEQRDAARKSLMDEGLHFQKEGNYRYRNYALCLLRDSLKDVPEYKMTTSENVKVTLRKGRPEEVEYPNGTKVSATWKEGEMQTFTDGTGKKYTRTMQQGRPYWADKDGKLWDGSIYLNEDGTWGVTQNNPKYDYHHYFSDGREQVYHDGGPYIENSDSSSFFMRRDGSFGSFHDGHQNFREIKFRENKPYILDRVNGRDRETPVTSAEGYFDRTTGTYYTWGKDGLKTGDTMYGGTIKFNKGDLPVEHTVSGKTTRFEYEKNSNVPKVVVQADGTRYERVGPGKYQVKKPGSDKTEEWLGEITVNRNGEYTLSKGDTGTTYKLSGNIERRQADKSRLILDESGKTLLQIIRPDGTRDRFTYKYGGIHHFERKDKEGNEYYGERGDIVFGGDESKWRYFGRVPKGVPTEFDVSVDASNGTVTIEQPDKTITIASDGKVTEKAKPAPAKK